MVNRESRQSPHDLSLLIETLCRIEAAADQRKCEVCRELLAKLRAQLPDSPLNPAAGGARRVPAASVPFWRAARRVFWRG
ncbi:MAG TPA: hypothetical protein VFX49_23250 [Chloroflexota bacterium]|nr:hypothetical protein [Chloroflexota bacterium]